MSRNNLRQARQEKGLTQKSLSAMIGIANRNYRHIEAGTENKGIGNIEIWQKLSHILEKPVDYLFKQEGCRAKNTNYHCRGSRSKMNKNIDKSGGKTQ